MTFLNGRAQPLRLLASGLVGYDELQEGLAVLAEHLSSGLSRPRIRLLAGRVVAVESLIGGATFIDTFRVLHDEYHFSAKTAFTVAARVHRGGGLTKDAVYLRGLVRMTEYLGAGKDVEPLLVGKIGNRHIPIVRELTLRGVLRAPPLRPRFLTEPGALERLAEIRQGRSVLELIETKRRKD